LRIWSRLQAAGKLWPPKLIGSGQNFKENDELGGGKFPLLIRANQRGFLWVASSKN
jgi:hypothetical protein